MPPALELRSKRNASWSLSFPGHRKSCIESERTIIELRSHTRGRADSSRSSPTARCAKEIQGRNQQHQRRRLGDRNAIHSEALVADGLVDVVIEVAGLCGDR